MQSVETVVVGGGQAGLATSYHLAQRGREHVVLEQAARPADSWRSARWDSFTLVTPNWTLRMPGAEYDGPDRDAYMHRDGIVAYFEGYAERFRLPVEYNTRAVSVEPLDGRGYRIQTEDRALEAENVVIATGWERLPRIPPFAAGLSHDILQIHASRYRNPEALPSGAVLVVGSAQSGCQIAEELHQSGRRVYLSTCGVGRAPRRYRGKDVFEWLYRIGFFDLPPDKFPVPKERFTPPHLSGKDGGHTINLHQFARDGVTLLGHLREAEGSRAIFAPDLHENLARADGFEDRVVQMVDRYAETNGLDAPTEELPRLHDGFGQPIVEELDLREAGIGTVLWATGYRRDFGFVKLPICDELGYPIQERGVSPQPGLYFAGMPWMPGLKPAILVGVGEAAEHVAEHIAACSDRSGRLGSVTKPPTAA